MRDESLSRRRVLSEIDAQYHSHDCSVDDVLRMLQFLYVISLEQEHHNGMSRLMRYILLKL